MTTMSAPEVWIAGAGFSGAVIARELAEAGLKVTVYEARSHVAGNCHTERDEETGVLVHRYGPHIFHTGDEEVWAYVNRFSNFEAYSHNVWTTVGNRVYPLPITLATINQYYDSAMSPETAMTFIRARAEAILEPMNFEEQALAMIGTDLYEAFFKGYTQKQWGRPPKDLPASILKRLPLRFSYSGGYFDHKYQGLPSNGYTALVEGIFDSDRIDLRLGSALDPSQVPQDAHLFWSGPLDAYFDHRIGRLGYRTLDFVDERGEGDYQGCPVMNYGDVSIPYTRITEHKHLAPWELHAKTFITREYSRNCGPDDTPYYPIRLAEEKALLADYVRLAEAESDVSFVGRLGTYRYLDMDVCIREALDAARAFLASVKSGQPMPVFIKSPV